MIPDDCEPGRALVYLHGGGYATGTLESTHALCSHLARATRARLLAVDYRLAPEHPFPAAVDDAVTAYRFAISAGYAPEAIALCGDSSGGGLALATLVGLRELGDPMPATAICMSPWTDLTLSGASLEPNRDADPMVSAATLALMADAYLGEVDRRSPTASPLFADLAGPAAAAGAGRLGRAAVRRLDAIRRAGAGGGRRRDARDLGRRVPRLAGLRRSAPGGPGRHRPDRYLRRPTARRRT